VGGSDLKSAERQQNRNYIKKNLNSMNIANFFGRILKKEPFCVVSCRTMQGQKTCAKKKPNMRPTELNWGVGVGR